MMIEPGSGRGCVSGEQGDAGVPAPHQRTRPAAHAQAAAAVSEERRIADS